MLRLNIRHQLPQTDLRITHGTLDSARTVPAQVHHENRQARSTKGITQSRIENIDAYESQRVTGRRTMLDLARERGQKGISDVRAADSRHTQNGWANAANGAKNGNDISAKYHRKLVEGMEAEPVFSLEWTKGVEVQFRTSELIGDIDVGDLTAEIQTAPSAEIRATQGTTQTYVKDQGFIRRWVTEDNYDIYA